MCSRGEGDSAHLLHLLLPFKLNPLRIVSNGGHDNLMVPNFNALAIDLKLLGSHFLSALAFLFKDKVFVLPTSIQFRRLFFRLGGIRFGFLLTLQLLLYQVHD